MAPGSAGARVATIATAATARPRVSRSVSCLLVARGLARAVFLGRRIVQDAADTRVAA